MRDPGKKQREHDELMKDPIMAAGVRGLDRLRWEMGVSAQTDQQLEALKAA